MDETATNWRVKWYSGETHGSSWYDDMVSVCKSHRLSTVFFGQNPYNPCMVYLHLVDFDGKCRFKQNIHGFYGKWCKTPGYKSTWYRFLHHFFLRFVIQLQRLRVFVWNLVGVQYEPAPLGTNAIKMDKIPEDRQQITCVLYSTGECRISAIRSR